MLEVFAKITCATMMTIAEFYIIKKILNSNVKIYSIKNTIYLVMLIAISVLIRPIQYTGLYTITIFLLNILAYKYIFNLSLEEATLIVSISMILLSSCDLIVSVLARIFYTIQEIRSNLNILTICNLFVCLAGCLIINIKYIRKQLNKFYSNFSQKTSIINIVFFILLIVGFCLLEKNITTSLNWKNDYIINILIMVIFIIITYIYITSRNSYNKLVSEYDSLFNYIQNFEEWIEKEQLNKHEYKNQLAVLRDVSNEQKVKKKIDNILKENMNLEGEIIKQLKTLPKGGIKGIMYYKTIIAQKSKINPIFDVSIRKKSIINRLSEKDMGALCKLIGIYFDNAIEAAVETKKRRILIEIYELKDQVKIVISNTFRKSANFNKRNDKGVSSKGESRGNGLYFARNLINKSSAISQKQKIIDEYYIQELSIGKLEK